MTSPNVVRDLLIKLPSLSRSPSAPVLDTLSLPARSTRLILETFSVPDYRMGAKMGQIPHACWVRHAGSDMLGQIPHACWLCSMHTDLGGWVKLGLSQHNGEDSM